MKWLGLLAISVFGCSSRPPASAKIDSTTSKATPAFTPAPTVVMPPNSTAALPSMPRYPEAGRGRMVVLSAGPAGSEAITRDWPADAGLCETPSRLLVKSEQPGAGGTLLLLRLSANRVTTYPVASANRGTPPPAAMAGIQVYSKTGPLAYQATEGAVELTALGETVSGRFGLTVREVNRRDQLRYAGSFREVAIVKLDSTRCASSAPIGAPQH